ncbi:IclR family transcriptional regulator [Roseomonas sp. NAR14]|uniref:IclR family transcriptional regulator n=1 Tax=Roseomonas acroporae TaxID=2937791 RepID=A0A9X1Y5K6_9PROT|nr:IclR family transcriptional regulator [Roseomonas acroporae]MCK8784639.1 IclR family transcriptional regulator [Roseomonas acroporae]
MADPAGGEDRQFVTALARGLDILHAFTARDDLLGNQELAARTGLPKPTVSRLTHTLTVLGHLVHVPRFNKYRLGLATVSLGQTALAALPARVALRPLMQALSTQVEASVSLGGRHRLSMLYVEHCSPLSPVALQLGVGSRIPLAVTAMGRAYYALAAPEERAEIGAQLAARFPERWPALRRGLAEAAEMHAALGFVTSVGDWNNEVHAAGAAFALPDGTVLALNCGAPAFLMPRERVLREAGPRVAELARQARRLGGG